MPKKIRELKAMLRQAGFTFRPGKGSHMVWKHPRLRFIRLTLAGKDGDDAKGYQERDVEEAIRLAKEQQQ